jgi:hypothetical protein
MARKTSEDTNRCGHARTNDRYTELLAEEMRRAKICSQSTYRYSRKGSIRMTPEIKDWIGINGEVLP